MILVENNNFDIDKIDIDTLGVFVPRRLEGRMDYLVKEKLRELKITKVYPDGNVDLSNLELNKLPIKFNKVIGDFDCYENNLVSLENCPKEVGGDFNCANNKIKFTEEQMREGSL